MFVKFRYVDFADLDDHLSDPSLSPFNGCLFSGFADLVSVLPTTEFNKVIPNRLLLSFPLFS